MVINLNTYPIKLGFLIDMHQIIGLLLLFNIVNARYDVYNGYSTYQVVVKDIYQLDRVNSIEDQLALDVWSPALPGRPGTVLVPQDKTEIFEDALHDSGVMYKIEVKNIKDLLDLEQKLLSVVNVPTKNASTVGLPFDKIHDYYKVNDYIENLAKKYPDLVTLVTGGKSCEGKPIKYLKISTTKFKDVDKPVIYLQSLLHAREWISLPATLYAIEKLVLNVTEHDIQQNIDWIILPIVNPDGYIETHTDFRFWRKNRAKNYSEDCIGVDLNRNFDHNWASHSSNLPCHDTFHGGGAFSEPETSIVRDILHEHFYRMKLFVDLHSFGSNILYPYGNGVEPNDIDSIHDLGIQMANAIDGAKTEYNPNYIVGNSELVMYTSSGSSIDYAHSIGIPYPYIIELPGYRFGGKSVTSFLVEPSFIKQAGVETWQGIVVAARNVLKKYGPKETESVAKSLLRYFEIF